VPPTRKQPIARVTLADVARLAGVSSAVVSYVINNGPRPVAPATAKRVQHAIDVLEYRPNTHARALMTGSTGILGLIHPGTGNPFFGEYNDVIYQTASRAGIALLTATSAGRADTERDLIEDLARRNVDGILVVTSMVQSDLSRLHDPRLPLVFLNCPFAIPGHRTIGPDGTGGARSVVSHLLIAHKHRQVALIAGQTSGYEPDDRELGWRDAHKAHRRTEGPKVRAAFTLDAGYDATRGLLARRDRPTAIFVSSDLQTYGAMHAIHEHQLRIPEDIAVASFDGNAGSAHTWPPLTLVQQPVQAMAEAAMAAMLIGEPPTHTLFEMDLILRRSCGCTYKHPNSRVEQA
jgi:LacI family transcriptional regulator